MDGLSWGTKRLSEQASSSSSTTGGQPKNAVAARDDGDDEGPIAVVKSEAPVPTSRAHGFRLQRPAAASASGGGSSSKKRKYMRQYNDSYLQLGFTCLATSEGSVRPHCVLCYELLANESMKPSKLARHLHAKHAEHVGKPLEFFEQLRQQMAPNAAAPKESAAVQPLSQQQHRHSALLKVSYQVALLVARSRHAPSVAERLVLPAAAALVEELYGAKGVRKLRAVPLAPDAIQRGIDDLACDVEMQVLARLRDGVDFAIQLDEYNEAGADPELLVYVRFPWTDPQAMAAAATSGGGRLHEDLLFSQVLSPHATGEEVFLAVHNYFVENCLSWEHCVGVCSDCEAAVTGLQNGAITLLLNAAPAARWTHCFLHRQALASEEISAELSAVLDQVVAIVSYVKSCNLNEPALLSLCEALGADDPEEARLLVQCSTVRWLSRGRVLERFYQLRRDFHAFLAGRSCELAAHLESEAWLAQVAYLADIFGEVHKMASERVVVEVDARVNAFKLKLVRWRQRFKRGETSMFPLFTESAAAATVDLAATRAAIVRHLDGLQEKFSAWFPVTSRADDDSDWVAEPFLYVSTPHGEQLCLDLENDLISVACDSRLRMLFACSTLVAFWLHVQRQHPALARKALAHLLPFATPHFSDAAFAALLRLRSGRCSGKVELTSELRLALSAVEPRTARVIAAAQSLDSVGDRSLSRLEKCLP